MPRRVAAGRRSDAIRAPEPGSEYDRAATRLALEPGRWRRAG